VSVVQSTTDAHLTAVAPPGGDAFERDLADADQGVGAALRRGTPVVSVGASV